ncbi:hypothetical protein AUJ66_04665 [Candidatus Desantisbacteria bacterium CG1_02_38_46]|uniref:DUF3800 domain-containing protein n=3 Tax=unclassified Candidatus Desantisiibacteriota TaxID=3106372 RepID=A0A2H9P9T7_9BACT|nr:MAG: hypothetical protein AUJ66_04665 [Candidatus Desantisbacteria bacterium CG1_02_38_46]PIU52044.1 MAG: hypothetical protein COS91_01235 [Candidatus Desantisbacteria bacterium CG07_land_8_20_14_0_80_39_15]PIZ15025.1 MAG: hypothetical protein COY51_06615 [Candidatus Desantisbacteria bacterium CG_4_10_14_0_8_um_filter_39_17]
MKNVEKLYLFFDESGNFDFSSQGSQHLVFTSLLSTTPFGLMEKLNELDNKLLKEGQNIKLFHASEDSQIIRNKVFDILKSDDSYEIDSIIIEKPKNHPTRNYFVIYLEIYKCLLQYIFKRYSFNKVFIFTDSIPFTKKRDFVEKGIKVALRRLLGGNENKRFYIFHHPSESNYCLQAADYCGWAIYRKYGDWGDIEVRPYKAIEQRIKSEFNYYKPGRDIFYERNSYYSKRNDDNKYKIH